MSTQRRVVLILAVVAIVVLAGLLSYVVLTPSSSKPNSSPPPGVASCPKSPGPTAGGNWTTYHQNNFRTGFEPTANISAVSATWKNPTALDGDVYAEPLVCGSTVYVATEQNSVYAVNATNGNVLWRTNLGAPVPGSALPCGDIDPSGITSTPVIDGATGVLYAVAYLNDPLRHVLFGLNVDTGTVVSTVTVDPPGADVAAQQERGALGLANGYIYVPYGGLYGDCGQYHGWVVGAPVSGLGPLISYMVPTQREGAIWGTAGMAFATNGDLYVSTGNGASDTTFDYGDAVIELSPTLSPLSYFAPTDWATLNRDDTDLGSVAPTVLPDGNVFQIGKGGVGYLLSGTELGGIGGDIFNNSVCAGAYGGTAVVGDSILVPCVDGVYDVHTNATNFTVAWQSVGFDSGSPIVTGNVVWAVDLSNGDLRGFSLLNGTQLFSLPTSSVDHFISPTAAPGALFVGAGSNLFAFSLS